MNSEHFKQIRQFMKRPDNIKVLGEKLERGMFPPQLVVHIEDQGFEWQAYFDAREGKLMNLLELKKPGEIR